MFARAATARHAFRLCRSLVSGRASPTGTRYFLETSGVSLSRQLQKSGLVVNPLVLGSPFTVHDGCDETMDAMLFGAVREDRCNCLSVFSNNNDDPERQTGQWYSKSVESLVESGLDREGIVTIANLGNVSIREDVERTLDDALRLTDQEYLDFAMLKVDPQWKEGAYGNFLDVVRYLEELCQDNVLHGYGFSMSLEPFNMHTPAPNRGVKNMFFPTQFEHDISTNMPHCEFMAYPLSPTHAVPHALPMLPAAPEDESGDALLHDEFHDRHRKFTRAAVHPFCCYRGHGPPVPSSEDDKPDSATQAPKSATESAEMLKSRTDITDTSTYKNGVHENDPVLLLVDGLLPDEITKQFGDALDTLCPSLNSTPKIQDKVLRTVLSYGHEVVIVEPEINSALGKLSLKPSDIMSVDDVAIVFGSFMIPKEIDDALRDIPDEVRDDELSENDLDEEMMRMMEADMKEKTGLRKRLK